MVLTPFAGIPVREFESARSWYEQLLGRVLFLPHEKEALWKIAENRSVFINQDRQGRLCDPGGNMFGFVGGSPVVPCRPLSLEESSHDKSAR